MYARLLEMRNSYALELKNMYGTYATIILQPSPSEEEKNRKKKTGYKYKHLVFFRAGLAL